ncbi:glycosyltransferase [Pontibacter sp. Tf4]|uniref:glycosyltransferase n=1 Tax=Pontibacter sp. Tf4 TaxID=2761620 RepID=UPI001628A49A|nr:glycosyltransferase [Pontibacter sp. Tf4]MBB6610837.1 glycosyltransferase [Pontibacter sp. Tf4]
MAVNVLHFIETLGKGGAEILFVEYINALPEEFNNIVVYMRPPQELLPELQNVKAVYCLNYTGKKDIPGNALRLNSIIRRHQVSLLHTHLYWPTIIARLSTTFSKIPLLFHVHSLISEDAFKPNILSKYVEQLTYRSRHAAIFVSETAMKDYQRYIKTSGNTAVLHNFVRDSFFKDAGSRQPITPNKELRLVSVGNLKPQKNQLFLIKCMQQLSGQGITLDIYGEGDYRQELAAYIKQHNITHVKLRGSKENLHDLLKEYDAFVMASAYEGFCIAMAEAMALGLPCLVPDTSVWREVSGGTQQYFEPDNELSFVSGVLHLFNNPQELKRYSDAAQVYAIRYKKQEFIAQLVRLYYSPLRKDG